MSSKSLSICLRLVASALVMGVCSGCAVSSVYSGAEAAYNHHDIQNIVSEHFDATNLNHLIDNDPIIKQKANISVHIYQGMILLTGQAPTTRMIKRATQLASHFAHRDHIYNLIALATPVSFRQSLYDTWLSTKVRSSMMTSDYVSPSHLKVITENNTVFLMGRLPKSEADNAVAITRHVSGVKHVVKVFRYTTSRPA